MKATNFCSIHRKCYDAITSKKGKKILLGLGITLLVIILITVLCVALSQHRTNIVTSYSTVMSRCSVTEMGFFYKLKVKILTLVAKILKATFNPC